MAMQSLFIPIVTAFKQAGLNQAKASIGGLGRTFDSLAKNIGAAAGSFAAFQGLASSREFILDSIDATQRLERNLIALNQVYGNLAPSLTNFTKSVQDYGISQNQAAQASIFIGSVLKQYGFGVGEAADATQRIVKLSQDLATTYGYDVQEALLAVTALFRGEFDPIEKFGVAMKQNEINAELLARGLGDLEGAARENAEAQITLDFLFQRASDSVGAFARATDTLYAAQKRLQAATANLQAEFGEPFQKPLAEVQNILAKLVEDNAPGILELSDAIGQGLEAAVPTLEKLGTALFEIVQAAEPLIGIASTLGQAFMGVLNPALDALNEALGAANDLFDNFAAKADFQRLIIERDLAPALNDFFASLREERYDNTIIPAIINGLDEIDTFLTDRIANNTASFRALTGDIESFDDGIKSASVALRGKALATRDDKKAAEEAAATQERFRQAMRVLAGETRDANGELTGLSKIFYDIDEAAAQSNAKAELENLGISAGLIEEILTRPNWEQIFKDISTYAKLAAIDISSVMSVTAAAALSNTRAALAESIRTAFGADTGGGEIADYVGDFFDGIDQEIAKEAARRKLSKMGASEGLIEAIVGAAGWEEVFKDIVDKGIDGLQRLQDEFNKTRRGIEEVTAAAQELADAQAEALAAATEEAQAYINELQAEADRLYDVYLRAREAADNFLERVEDFNTIEILPNVEEDIGRFESAVISSVDNIRSELQSAFRSELIYQEDFEAISAFVTAEEFELRRLAQARDDLATRYSLSEALIGEYRDALTGALQLSQLYGQLKTETEKRTVTEIQRGVVSLGDSLKEFEVTVTRSFEETIQGVQDKSVGLLEGFRTMADKARAFAENLRKLREMGLDPMLFNQLVSAGVEAGGETAQALVDGGSDTITEINGLFTEINQLGADLGEEVAATMYGAGIDMTNGLLEGIASEQERLLELARSMAEAFSAEFNSRINIAVEKPVAAAASAAAAAQAAVPKIEDIDVAGLAQLNAYLENAGTALTKVTSDAYKAGIETKIGVVEALKADVLAGGQFDLSGIVSGLSSADLTAAALATGSASVTNNYNVTVQSTGNKATAYSDGIAFAEGLSAASATNPTLQTEVFN